MPDARGLRRWARLAVVAFAAGVVLGGCGGVPDSGDPTPVTNKKLRQDELTGPGVNAALPEPRPGGGPEDTVTRLLDAARTTQSRDRLGENFLTNTAQEAWRRPPTNVLIYRQGAITVLHRNDHGASVRLTGLIVGTVNDVGVYQPQSPPRSLTMTLNLIYDRVWLLDTALPGVLVRESDFNQAFWPVTLYFAALDSGTGDDVVAPEVRYLDKSLPSQSLVTPIVRMLLRGPSPWLAPATRNPLPRNTGLRSNVSLQDQDVVVDLSPEVESAKAGDLNAFAAEVAWSLRPYFNGDLRLQVSGRPLTVPGVDAVQGPDHWTRYNPIADSSASLYYVSRGALRKFTERADSEPDPQIGGQAARAGVLSAALSTDGSSMALVKSGPGDLQTLWVGDTQGQVHPAISGHRLTRPTWGHASDKLLIGVDGTLYQVDQVGLARPVALPRPTAPVRAVRLSLDGTRLALIAGDDTAARAYVGLFQPSMDEAPPVLRDLRQLRGSVPKMQDIAWSAPATVVVAGQARDGAPVVDEVTVDGAVETESPRTGLHAARLTIAATPLTGASALLYVESGHQLYQSGLRTWTPQTDIVDVEAPFYPG